jgi:hypothetical protein
MPAKAAWNRLYDAYLRGAIHRMAASRVDLDQGMAWVTC